MASERRLTYRRLIAAGFLAGVAADDVAAIHFVGTRVFRCVSSRRNARAYHVSRRRGRIIEVPMTTTFLSAAAAS